MQLLKHKITYLLLVFCLVGICFVAFNSTFKLLKQSVVVILTETNEADIEEDEAFKNTLEEDDVFYVDYDALYFFTENNLVQMFSHSDSKLVSTVQNIQIPPPKIS